MMLHIPEVLNAGEVQHLRTRLDVAQWVDGRATVGSQGAQVRQNRQLPEDAADMPQLRRIVEDALKRNGLFFSAALPLRVSPPLFNRYGGAEREHYGFHVDGAVRATPADPGWMRTDLSATLFLSEPDEYEGGDLTVRDTYGEHEVRLPAGDLVLYPSSSLHGVSPVTRGARVCSFLWIQSMIRNDQKRTMLFELDQTIQTLRSRHGESEETLSLSNHYHNLLREWSEI
ncbi:Fe2+-dependent dioxygenase [Caballeronia sp. LZ043]|uniref:Fe2+-dependent dioxygenase n=1 Tax=Caballeronia sp. LZ043 TaxID=3038569 RepID=UPI002866648B|nr:Fe2+-dependent dioxygenase [Caballeronia sp. LZ043]MDR5822449.1 Fe2+-dependent dioxygenase [Caballeronia sp. LZ043]